MIAKPQQHPTDRQIVRLYTLASKVRLDQAGVHAELLARYGVESTRELSLRQYEQFTSELERTIRMLDRGGTRRSPSTARGNLTKRAACERLLREEWPEIFDRDATLAASLVECLDCFRLTRLSGSMGDGPARNWAQKIQKAEQRDLRRTAAVYLERYTSKPERYFLVMLINARRDRMRQERRRQRHDQRGEAQRATAEGMAQDVIDRAGEPILISDACACEGKGRLWYRPAANSPFRFCPCPWCERGRAELIAQIKDGRRFDHVNWPLMREQIEERAERRSLEDGEPS